VSCKEVISDLHKKNKKREKQKRKENEKEKKRKKEKENICWKTKFLKKCIHSLKYYD
jgi:hypothetical protein